MHICVYTKSNLKQGINGVRSKTMTSRPFPQAVSIALRIRLMLIPKRFRAANVCTIRARDDTSLRENTLTSCYSVCDSLWPWQSSSFSIRQLQLLTIHGLQFNIVVLNKRDISKAYDLEMFPTVKVAFKVPQGHLFCAIFNRPHINYH